VLRGVMAMRQTAHVRTFGGFAANTTGQQS